MHRQSQTPCADLNRQTLMSTEGSSLEGPYLQEYTYTPIYKTLLKCLVTK